MKISVLSVSRVKQRFIREGEEEYLARLKGQYKLELVELGMDHPASLPEAEVKQREAKRLLGMLKDTQWIVALDERGDTLTSSEFSALLDSKMTQGTSQMVFIIGGAYGLDDSVKKRADRLISLSRMTFTYQMTRLILIEQLYRACTILKGSPYHK